MEPRCATASRLVAPSSLSLALSGAGDIAGRYASAVSLRPVLRVATIAAQNAEAAAPLAEKIGPKALTAEAAIADMDDPVVINLTPPQDHAAVTHAALTSGKRVYLEKPLGANIAGALGLMAHADRIACAPAARLSAAVEALQTLIGEGALGRVIGAIARVQDARRRARDTCTVGQGPRAGERFAVTVATHVTTLVEFQAGPTATPTTSFDGFASKAPAVELIGDAGAIALPLLDPLSARYWRAASPLSWTEEHALQRNEAYWPIGVLEAPTGWRFGPAPQTVARLAPHVLGSLRTIAVACETGEAQTSTTGCKAPTPIQVADFAANTAAFGPPHQMSAA